MLVIRCERGMFEPGGSIIDWQSSQSPLCALKLNCPIFQNIRLCDSHDLVSFKRSGCLQPGGTVFVRVAFFS